MRYKIFIRTLYIIFSSIELIHCSTKKKYGKFEIDDFLKKVMVSEKFDELAEKIADKAVEKFIKLRNSDKGLSGTKFQDTVYRVTETEVNESNNTADKEVALESQNDEEREKEKLETNIQHVINVKIDTDAFKKKKSNYLKELRLKYNRFTKSIYRDLSKEDSEAKLTDSEGTTPRKHIENISEDAVKPSTKAPELSDDSNDHDAVNLNPRKLPTTKSKQKMRLPPKNIMDSFSSRNKENVDEPNKDYDHSENNDDKEKSIENTKFNEQVESAKEETKEDGQDNSAEPTPLIQDDNKSTYLKDGSENNKVATANKNSDQNMKQNLDAESTVNKEEIIQKKEEKRSFGENVEKSDAYKRAVKIPIRKEGNKLYTLERSPDYEDYHQEVERIQKELREKNKRKANSLDFKKRSQ